MSITYEELELEQFKAYSTANTLARKLASLFIGRKVEDLTSDEWEVVACLTFPDPLGVIKQPIEIEDGVLLDWEHSKVGIAYWKAIYEGAGYNFETKTWRQDD